MIGRGEGMVTATIYENGRPEVRYDLRGQWPDYTPREIPLTRRERFRRRLWDRSASRLSLLDRFNRRRWDRRNSRMARQVRRAQRDRDTDDGAGAR